MSSLAQVDFYLDVYGRKRNSSTKMAIFEPFNAPCPFMGADALVITEVSSRWEYMVPTLPAITPGIDSKGHEYPTSLIVTSPNVDFIPDISKGAMEVRVRVDGRYALDDFTLCPQWYFEGTYYLPYMRRRPNNVEGHELEKIWYDLKRTDFVLEQGGLFSGLGRIKKELADEFLELRRALAAKIKLLQVDTRFSGVERAELLYAKQAMQFASIILACAPQTFELTLLTVTGFQRHYLEALACYEYLTIYRDMDCEDEQESSEPIGADTSLMGAFTTSIEVAEKLYRHKVPVWLVRIPAQVPLTTSIVSHIYAEVPPHIVWKALPNSHAVYTGHASAIRNRACQALKIGNIRLGHRAYSVQPGDFNAQYIADNDIKNPYSGPLAAGPSSSSSPSHPNSLTTTTLSSSSRPSSRANNIPSMMSSNTNIPPLNAQPGSSPPSVGFVPQWRNISHRFAINDKKFVVVPGLLSPSANPAWTKALRMVTSDWHRILDHDNLGLWRGYAFPDPGLFLKESPLTRQGKLYALGWLALRSAWMARVVDVSEMTYLKPQEWRDLLGVDIARALGLSDRLKKSVESRNKRQKMTVSRRDDLGIDWDSLRESPEIFWKKSLVCPARSTLEEIVIPNRIYKEIEWDVMEHNFRLELLALDRSIFPRQYLSSMGAMSRDDMVAACIPRQAFVSIDWPGHDEGLGARAWEDRMEYVEAFRVLLSTWPGDIPSKLKSLRPIVRHTGNTFTGVENKVKEVEQLAYPFYCQTFFDFFGRAASIPFNCPL